MGRKGILDRRTAALRPGSDSLKRRRLSARHQGWMSSRIPAGWTVFRNTVRPEHVLAVRSYIYGPDEADGLARQAWQPDAARGSRQGERADRMGCEQRQPWRELDRVMFAHTPLLLGPPARFVPVLLFIYAADRSCSRRWCGTRGAGVHRVGVASRGCPRKRVPLALLGASDTRGARAAGGSCRL